MRPFVAQSVANTSIPQQNVAKQPKPARRQMDIMTPRAAHRSAPRVPVRPIPQPVTTRSTAANRKPARSIDGVMKAAIDLRT